MLAIKSQSPQSQPAAPAQRPQNKAQASPPPNPVWRSLALGLQRKPTIGAPGDPYEREADSVADRVLRMAAPTPPAIQRKCAACASAPEDRLQTKGEPCAQSGADLDTGTAMQAANRGGTALPGPVRDYFEPRLGHDLGQVRVHADREAAHGAQSIQARAYTIGRDIVFGAGEYSPGTASGRRLLAHELTHVVQQGAAAPQATAAAGSLPGPIASAGAQRIQRDWLDDAKAAVGGAYESAASTVGDAVDATKSTLGDAYDSVAATVGTVGTGVAEAAKSVSATASGAAQTVEDPERLRASLISQTEGTRQKVHSAGPDGVRADASQIASLNTQISSFNAALPSAAAAIPLLAPPAAGAGVGIGAAIEGALVAIAAALGISVGWLLVIIAVIVLAIIALIIYLFRDTKKYPDPDTETKPEDKTKPKDKADPKEKPDPEKKPDDRPPPPPPPPPEPERRKPDCCPGPTPRGEIPRPPNRFDKRHPYFRPGSVQVKDNRNKHTANIVPSNGARCDVAFLQSAAAGRDPTPFGPCLGRWIAAAGTGDRNYGSQLGSDTVGRYLDVVEDIVMDPSNQIDSKTWFGDTGGPIGVDIATPGAPAVTDNARIDDAPAKAHIIPLEDRP